MQYKQQGIQLKQAALLSRYGVAFYQVPFLRGSVGGSPRKPRS
jgi:hypothetical protein